MVATREPESEGKLPREKVPPITTIAGARDVLAALDYQEEGPSFVALAAGTLGDAGTNLDGYDAAMLDILATLDGDAAAPADLAEHVAAADFVNGQFIADNGTPLADELAAFKEAGDNVVNEVNTSYGGTPQPPPVTPPAITPPTTGGGITGGHDSGYVGPWVGGSAIAPGQSFGISAEVR